MRAVAAVLLAATACAAEAPVAPPPAPTTAPAPPPVPSTPSTAPATAPPPTVPPPRAGRGVARTTTTHDHRPAVEVEAPEGNAGAMEQQLARIAECESGGRYDAENPRSTASGRYQVLDSTWDGYGGYERAVDAPPAVQEAWAREAYADAGTRPWRASRGCWAGAA